VVLAIAAVLLHRPAATPYGCLDYHVLDVGQGLATVLRAGDYTVLFDTGPSFRSGSSAAKLVIAPFLKARGIQRLDALIVSHADQDHAGGVQALASEFAIGRTLVGEFVTGTALPQAQCSDASSWMVNGVQFRFLHPLDGAAWEGNNASCVVEVVTGKYKLLLTGDIERPVEAALLANERLGRVDAVVVPHHGSGTSSSLAFVTALRPELAIVSAGFGNRWGFPKDDVVRRWEQVGARVLNTATHGAISQRVCADSGIESLQLERRDGRKFWH
jgi:competence protein ComEC